MKVIFLDVDGVLNSNADYRKTKYKMRVGGNGCIGIYRERLKNLKMIVDATGAVIVLTSSWKTDYAEYIEQYKKGYPMYAANKYGKYLREKLRSVDLEVYDTTIGYEKNTSCRGEGIKKYVEKHEDITGWVVLDDDIFNDYDSEIMGHLVLTSCSDGALNEDDVNTAIEILNK